ncbi:Potassium channel [Mortierella sp. GBA43]|nr:Potassium channel [Mortierella sp. GBA43]
MWNPPPPDLQINIKRRLDVPGANYPRSNAPNAFVPSNDASPRISQTIDRERGLDSSISNYNDVSATGRASNDRLGNGYSGNALPYTASFNRPTITSTLPHPRLEKVGPYLTVATLQAYTVLTVVRCLANPVWIRSGHDRNNGPVTHVAEIGSLERIFLACAIGFTMLSCLGVTLRIMDKLLWLRKIPVITAYLEACVITVVFSSIVAVMLTIDWWRGFPSAGLSATLKALIISSFVMTIVIIIGAGIYSALEEWSFDDAVNFCIVSFATIGYGNLSPKTSAGQIIFFFYGLFGISSVGFFVVSLRNAVIEQFQWRLLDRFSKPAHLTRVQTRMSAKDISFPEARFEEEQRVKLLVKRKMIVRMMFVWIGMWFGGAGIFCAFEQSWTFLESLYFCFVTLTTIGFGDYVPTQPGAIEFWNVYVFVGLSVFAYILSLSSESMAAQIHLVDDRDDDDDMYGWERNEDPNAPLTTRSGILGIEGLKWLQHQQQLQMQGTNTDLRLDEDGKLAGNIGSIPNTMQDFDGGIGLEGDRSIQSTTQRSRSKTKGSTGRVLTVSARERKQMLQAEYYASHSLPATIRFVDTKGVPHEKTIRRGASTRESISGPSGGAGSDHTGVTYGTVGYYGTIGRRDLEGIRHASHLRNRQSINGRDTPQGRRHSQFTIATSSNTLRGAGGRHGEGLDERRESEVGHIPSCMDLFKQTNQRDGGEGSSKQSNKLLGIQEESIARVRSNSWDQSSTQRRSGPSQNEIHRWMAEGAGTLEGPSFNYIQKETSEPHPGSNISRQAPQGSTTSLKVVSALDLVQEQHQEGVPPDVIVIPLTSDPAVMSAEEEEQFHAGKDVVQPREVSSSNPQHPLQPSPPSAREPSLPPDLSTIQPSSKDGLFLGGGAGAGYGSHAYGVPFQGSVTTTSGGTVPAAPESWPMDDSEPLVLNRTISEASVGPFDETRDPETIPHFDQDVDLNHLELSPQQIEDERKRRAELKKREKDIEARLATLREMGRGDYA